MATGAISAALRNNELMIRLLRYIIVPLNPGLPSVESRLKGVCAHGFMRSVQFSSLWPFNVGFRLSRFAIHRGSSALDFNTGVAAGEVMYLIRALPASAFFVFDATPAPKLM